MPANTLPPKEVPVSDWQRKLVRERLAAHERGEGGTVPWSIVSREAEGLLRNQRNEEIELRLGEADCER